MLSQHPSRSHSPFPEQAREEHKILGCVSSWLEQQTEAVPGSTATDALLEGTEPPRPHCKRLAGCRHPLFQLQLLAGALPNQWCLHGSLVTKSAQVQRKNRKHSASPKPQVLHRGKNSTHLPSGLKNTPNKPQSTECKLQQALAGSLWLRCSRLQTVPLQAQKDTPGAGLAAGNASGRRILRQSAAPRAALGTEASVSHSNGNTTGMWQRSCDITAAAHAKTAWEVLPCHKGAQRILPGHSPKDPRGTPKMQQTRTPQSPA